MKVPEDTFRTPYVGLVPFDEGSAELFFGRSTEICRCVSAIMARRVVVIHGVSGVGKTSLLRAGVVPRLKEGEEESVRKGLPPFQSIYFREWSAASQGRLSEAFQRASGLRPSDMSVQPPGIERFYVILDQFEELFRYEGCPFAPGSLLSDLVTSFRKNPGMHLVFSIRDDSLARLDILRSRLPEIFSHLVRIDHLNEQGATEAITRPLDWWTERFGENVICWSASDILVNRLLAETRHAETPSSYEAQKFAVSNASSSLRIEAAYLQLCLEKLWRLHQRKWEQPGVGAERVLDLDGFDEGSIAGIVDQHVEDCLNDLSKRQQELFATLTRVLVTPDIQKYALSLISLQSEAKEGPFRFREKDIDGIAQALESLERSRILRRVDRGGEAAGDEGRDDLYEVYHDIIAKSLVPWRDEVIGSMRSRGRHRRVLVAVVFSLLVCASLLISWFAVKASKSAAAEFERAIEANTNSNAASERARSFEAEGRVLKEQLNRIEELVKKLESVEKERPDPALAEEIGRTIVWTRTFVEEPAKPERFTIQTGDSVSSGAFSQDGRIAVIGSRDKNVYFYYLDSDSSPVKLSASTTPGGVTSLAFAKWDRHEIVISGSAGNSIRVFDLSSGRPQPKGEINVHRDTVTHVEFSPDGPYSISSSADRRIALLDWSRFPESLPDKSIAPDSWKHDRTITYATFSHDGSRVVTSSDDGSSKVFETSEPFGLVPVQLGGSSQNPFSVNRRARTPTPFRRMRFSPVDRDLVVGGAGLRMFVSWSLKGDRIVYVRDDVKGGQYFHSGAIWDSAFQPSGMHVATVGTDGRCIIWRMSDSRSVAEISTDLRGRIFAVGWKKYGEIAASIDDGSPTFPSLDVLALGGEDGWLELWDMKDPTDPKPLFAAKAHDGVVRGLAFNPSDRLLMTWSGYTGDMTLLSAKGRAASFNRLGVDTDGSAKIWDIADAMRSGWTARESDTK